MADELFYAKALRAPKRGQKKVAWDLGFEAAAKATASSTEECPYPAGHYLRESWINGFLCKSEAKQRAPKERPEPRPRPARTEIQTVPVTVHMPVDLYDELTALLDGRGSDLSTFLVAKARAYLRTPSTFELHTRLPFPKWAGTPLEDVIRMDPAYVRWMDDVNPRFRMSEQAHTLLEKVDPHGR